MVLQDVWHPAEVFDGGQLLQKSMPFATTPMVLAECGQHGISKSELRLGNVAADEVRIVGSEMVLPQALAREKQPGAPIHHQSRGLRHRNVRRVTVPLTTGQQPVVASNPPM